LGPPHRGKVPQQLRLDVVRERVFGEARWIICRSSSAAWAKWPATARAAWGRDWGEHGLADTWRAMEQHVVPTRRGYFAGPLSLDLTDHICQVKTTVRMPTGPLSYYLDGSTGGIGTPLRRATS
jgi:hypothetical protein